MQTETSEVVNVDEEKDNTFQCKYCDFKTYYYSRLVSHAVVHSLERPYTCEYCHYAAKRKSDLKKHHVHKHKLIDPNKQMKKGSGSSSQTDGGRPSSNSSQTSKSIPVTYTLSPEQEVAQSPESIHNDSEEISIHSGSDTPTIKIELDDESEMTNTQQYEYTIPLPTASSFTDNKPVTVNLPQMLFPHSRGSTSFTPTITSIGSLTMPNSHRPTYSTADLHSNSEMQGMVGSNGLSANHTFPPLTRSGPLTVKDVSTLTSQGFFCSYCNVLYFDNGLYVMHMGLHHSENPWQCNLCGKVHNDVYSFTLHFITQHKS